METLPVIVVFGAINLDLIFPLHAMPQHDVTAYVGAAQIGSGGKGGNQAVAAARDGGRVALVGAVGDDPLGPLALAGPVAAGVDVSRVARVTAHTGTTSICLDDKQQSLIVEAIGANPLARAAQIEDAALGPDTVLLIQMGMEPGEIAALIRRARRRGARVMLNFSPPGMIDTEALRAVDLLLLDEGDSGWLSAHLGAGVGAGSLRAALGTTVVRTLGVAGLEYADAAGNHEMAALTVDVVDRTAGQDCLAGVLAAGLDRGLPLDAALRRANVAAALSTLRIGTQASLPDADAITRGMEQYREQERQAEQS